MRHVWKLTPVSCYDLSGLESWLESLAAQGLFPKKIRPVRSVFTRGTPRPVRYRIEYCKKAGRDGLPQDLVELYREFGWDYAGPLPNRTLLLFSTQNPQAEEPHTDPPLQGELLEQLLRKLKQELWVSAFSSSARFSNRYPSFSSRSFISGSFPAETEAPPCRRSLCPDDVFSLSRPACSSGS